MEDIALMALPKEHEQDSNNVSDSDDDAEAGSKPQIVLGGRRIRYKAMRCFETGEIVIEEQEQEESESELASLRQEQEDRERMVSWKEHEGYAAQQVNGSQPQRGSGQQPGQPHEWTEMDDLSGRMQGAPSLAARQREVEAVFLRQPHEWAEMDDLFRRTQVDLSMAATNDLTQENQQLMDNYPLPRGILYPASGLPRPPPPAVKTWADLKAWMRANSADMPRESEQKLRKLQSLHYQSVSRGQQQGMRRTAPVVSGLRAPSPSSSLDVEPGAGILNDDTGYKDRGKGRCPHPDCGRLFKDLKAHMMTHQSERPEKCPVVECDYHEKGFARKNDLRRHTLTHYKGSMVCEFCPGSGTSAEKTFNRVDVFKRHLTSVHGIEPTYPRSRKTGQSASTNTITSPSETGRCPTCSAIFHSAQDFYEHLDDCVLRVVQSEQLTKLVSGEENYSKD